MKMSNRVSDSPPSLNRDPIAGSIRVGTMGWSYPDWSGVFYPSDAAPGDYVRLYSRAFDTVEIDSTFYATPRDRDVKRWRAQSAETFIFCAKVPRQITHDARLVDVSEMLGEFVRVMGLLGAKRGPMLLQMPPDFTRAEMPSLEDFLPTLAGISDRGARFAIEFRHRSWSVPEVPDLLARYGVALASTDYVIMPRRLELTTDLVYLRLIGRHGQFPRTDKLYADRSRDLERWAEALQRRSGDYSTAFILVNNEYEGYAPATAGKMKRLLGMPEVDAPSQDQGVLF